MPRAITESISSRADARGRGDGAAGTVACWIGMHEGRVAASDRSLGRLIARLKKDGIAVEEATFRFVNDREKLAGLS